eukprot:682095-Alexandrium_andersonii.AAC.1
MSELLKQPTQNVRSSLKTRAPAYPLRPIIKVQGCDIAKLLRRSKFELSRPRSSLKFGPRSSGGVRSVPLFAQLPNLVTKRVGGHGGGASRRGGGPGGETPGKTY